MDKKVLHAVVDNMVKTVAGLGVREDVARAFVGHALAQNSAAIVAAIEKSNALMTVAVPSA